MPSLFYKVSVAVQSKLGILEETLACRKCFPYMARTSLNKDPDYKRTSTLGKPSVISLQTPNCQHQPIRRDSVYYIGRTIASNR